MALTVRPPFAAVLALGSLLHAEASWYVVSGPCGEDGQNCITSPGFDEGSGYNDAPCVIQTGDVFFGASVEFFDTEVMTDVLSAGSRAYSGTNQPPIDFMPGTMTWTSDDAASGGGFKICAEDLTGAMWKVSSGPCTFDKDTGCITTPSWPADYTPNSRCDIEIPAGFGGGTVVGFELDPSDPLIMPDDSLFYGGIPANIYPLPNSQLLWSPDATENSGGWKLCELTHPPGAPSVLASTLGMGGSFESMPASVVVANADSWNSAAVQAASGLASLPQAAAGRLSELGSRSVASWRRRAAGILGGAAAFLSLAALVIAVSRSWASVADEDGLVRSVRSMTQRGQGESGE